MTPIIRDEALSPPSLRVAGLAPILLIEDDFFVRRTLAELLVDEGYQVDCAANGGEALMRLQSNPTKPGLIILDLWMPYMDGLEFRAIQMSLSKWADIPVMVITAGGAAPSETEALGLHHVLRKPLDLGQLLEMVERLLSERDRGPLQ